MYFLTILASRNSEERSFVVFNHFYDDRNDINRIMEKIDNVSVIYFMILLIGLPSIPVLKLTLYNQSLSYFREAKQMCAFSTAMNNVS